jgi:predicted Zn-dependent protease
VSIGAAAQAEQRMATSPTVPNADQSTYGQLVALYRAGEIDRAVERLDSSLASAMDAQQSGQVGLDAWIDRADLSARSGREPGRLSARRDLEAMMLLATETLMRARSSRRQAIDVPERYWQPIEKLQERLKKIDPATPFLRAWYLLWQAFRQRHITDFWLGWKDTEGPLRLLRQKDAWGGWLEYSRDAEAAFPDDALVRLALGARRELDWWKVDVNPHRYLGDVVRVDRDAGGRDFPQEALEAAASHLRRSVALDPAEGEAVLRLARVLVHLDRLDEAERILAAHAWKSDEAAFEYLARLFEGEIKELRKDLPGALTAYDRAIGLVPYAQAARMAKAHTLEMLGRQGATELAASSLTAPEGTDPWWLYLSGESWRLESYLRNARAQVMR